MMKKIVYSAYPVFINIYTVWILYMMFFAYNRGEAAEDYIIRARPFESISYILNATWDHCQMVKNIAGNILLFVPYGFLGVLYPKLKKYILLFPVFFIGINFLEFLQLFSRRGYAEFDDVMLNTLGMTIGYGVYYLLFLKSEKSG